MTLSDIANIRLSSQQIAETKFESAKEIVGWMGAMQAQDYAMSKWALGIRFPDSTDKIIETAIDNADIIRTHLLRPTWHLVSSEDIYWMLELTSPQIKTQLKSRAKFLELSETILSKCNTILEKSLANGNHMPREELKIVFENAKIATDDNRLSHIMLHAEIEGIVCSGAVKEKKQTYALLPERVAKTKELTREEALAKLATKYFSSHCPASLQDFIWWSGLSIRDARNALEMVKSKFISETVNSETYWLTNSFSIPENNFPTIYLLPAFDEFIISYKDRTASLLLENYKKAVSNNGIFRPVIVANGQVIGLWKRTLKNDYVIIETEKFQSHNKVFKNLLEEKVMAFGSFLGKETRLILQ